MYQEIFMTKYYGLAVFVLGERKIYPLDHEEYERYYREHGAARYAAAVA